MKTSSLSEYAATFIGEPYEWPALDWCNLYVQAWLEYYGMTEKKTFKNPKITSYLDFIWVGWGEPYALDQGTTQFNKDEWDWEVTFTKKVPDFSPGWFLYSDVPDGYEKEIQWFSVPPPNNGWERVHNRG